MIGTCNVFGIIGQLKNNNGEIIKPNVTFLDVVSQVEKQKDITELQVFINSPGGSVEESDSMYEYFMALKAKGIKITTTAQKVCMSAAVKILLSGDEGKRYIEEETVFMIHNPWLSLVDGDADTLEAYGRELRKLENESVNFYSERTKTSREALKTLMKKDTYLTVEQVIDFGFVDNRIEVIQLKAVAFSNKINKENNMNEGITKNEAVTLFERMFNNIKEILKPVQVKMVIDATGDVEIIFNDIEKTATPSDGDIAMIDGKLANGEHTMPNGDIYTFNDKGELKIKVVEVEVIEEVAIVEDVQEVIEDENVEVIDEEKEALKAEIEELKAEIEKLNKEKEEADKAIQINKTVLIDLEKDMVQLKNSISSNFSVDVANDNKSKGASNTGSRQLFKK